MVESSSVVLHSIKSPSSCKDSKHVPQALKFFITVEEVSLTVIQKYEQQSCNANGNFTT